MSLVRQTIKLVKALVDAALADVHTHMIAEVISYNSENNTVKVQPAINRIRTDDPNNPTTVALPVIDDVPVGFFGDGKFIITLPLAEGSQGVLHFSERAIDSWLKSAEVVDPTSARRFDLSDAIFYPGIPHNDLDIPYDDEGMKISSVDGNVFILFEVDEIGEPSNISIETKSASLRVESSGIMHIENDNGSIYMTSAGKVSINGDNFTVFK